MDIFKMNMENNLKKHAPLAERLRPKKLEDFVGQTHLIGEGKFLSRSIKADRITSMILYGPPGTGKTTLAMIIASGTQMLFEKLSAVTSGVKDLREVIFRAEENLKLNNKRTVLFIDEIHRYNKSQQDALLPVVEQGIIILIGATTENPFFEINKALLSRMTIIELRSLGDAELDKIIDLGLNNKSFGFGDYKINISKEAREYLIRTSNGDARTLLNGLEISILSTEKDSKGEINIGLEEAKNSIQKRVIEYDKGSDEHYDTISAFIKSMRGSDPDATIYWLAKMIYAGEDPVFIARRIIICAAEDVGLADPNALSVAVAAFEAVRLIGMPEGRIPLAEAAVYVATAAKSNKAYLAINEALKDMAEEKKYRVPSHLRDGQYPGAKSLGNSIGYKYPHNFEGAYIEQEYLPKELGEKRYYEPTEYGYEKKIKEYLRKNGLK